MEFHCTDCDEAIVFKKVAHSIRDGLFSLSGLGDVRKEDVPYCPVCEQEPVFHGRAIIPENTPRY